IWFENPTFEDPIEPPWYSEIEGDLSDIKVTTSSGQANYIVVGDHGEINIDDPLNNIDWTPYNNPEFPISPDINGSDSTGLFISHEWDEGVDQSRNSPSIHWKRNITTPINFSDYIITSASLEVIFNASVTAVGSNPSQPHIGGIERPGDYTEGQNPPGDTQFGIGDFATFYVLISDLANENSFQIALNRTTDLGRDTPEVNNYSDTAMNIIPEDILISYLTTVLENDYQNFTITLGIDIYCEDNEWNVDIDTWDLLTIRTFNLTFNYEKKINQFSIASWNQDGDKIADISNDTVIIDEAKLNFKYSIDDSWTSSSPNSEIRAYINNNKLSETIKLSTANSSFQTAKPGGFDVTSLIPYNIGINLSIQLYIADQFGLDKNITISIDDLYLNITYTVIFPDTQTNLGIFFNGINKTDNPVFDLPLNEDLNITIKYPDDLGDHISGAVVQLSGDLIGTLAEDVVFEQYTIIIPANTLEVKTYYFDVFASRINYEARIISPILIVSKVTTDSLQLLLNGQNKTSDPFFNIALNKLLNITVKYKENVGIHVPGAIVELVGDGIFETLIEDPSFEQYSIVLNTSIKFSLGLNDLTIVAQESDYQEQSINPRITVRKINAEIRALPGYKAIKILPGGTPEIRVNITDTDFNKLVKGATVTATYIYRGTNATILLTDLDNDGIYKGILSDPVPKGIHSITIDGFGSDIYNFISEEIVITAAREAGNTLLFQILTIIGIISTIAIGGYFYAYQKVLKYPKTVRKVRKYRKTLSKKNPPHMEIKDRDKSFNITYINEVSSASKYLKGKPSSETIKTTQKSGSKIEKGGVE
ncbi:MAG: hypothetical protein ACFFEO_12430, partial [Candidatus Thorarchaeota archaeon]